MKRNFLLTIFFVFLNILQSYAAQNLEKSDPPAPKEKPLKLYIEAGATLSRGNSREENIYAKNNLDYKHKEWTEILRTRLENKKANNQRIKERYDANNQLRYNFSKLNYRFSEVEYISDRYGGFKHRISETFGFGRNLIQKQGKDKKDIMTLSLQAGLGLRQSKFIDGKSENGILGRSAIHFYWKIKDGIIFDENLDISADQENVITKSDASLKVMINKSFYIQLGLFIENRSKAPTSNVKKTDSTFMTMIGYSY